MNISNVQKQYNKIDKWNLNPIIVLKIVCWIDPSRHNCGKTWQDLPKEIKREKNAIKITKKIENKTFKPKKDERKEPLLLLHFYWNFLFPNNYSIFRLKPNYVIFVKNETLFKRCHIGLIQWYVFLVYVCLTKWTFILPDFFAEARTQDWWLTKTMSHLPWPRYQYNYFCTHFLYMAQLS